MRAVVSLYDNNLTLRQPSMVRQPVLRVMVGKQELTGVLDVQVTNNSHFTADTFHLTAALNDLPPAMNLRYWGDSQGDEIEIFVGFKNSDGTTVMQSMFYGRVDDVEPSLDTMTLSLSGRDLSGDLIDSKSAEHFADQPCSEIVKLIAARHGLTANVTATTTRSGKFYELVHARITQDQSEWDLLLFLAQEEGFDLWVAGKTLYFHPPNADKKQAYLITRTLQPQHGNCISLKLHRSQTLAKDVIVKLRSWNQTQGKTVTATAKVTKASGNQRSGGKAQIYSFTVPNLDQTQADRWAKAKAEEISKHERVITATLDGDNALDMRKPVQLVGTNTSWDQLYFIDTLTRHISMDAGYVMDLRAKNHSAESTVLV